MLQFNSKKHRRSLHFSFLRHATSNKMTILKKEMSITENICKNVSDLTTLYQGLYKLSTTSIKKLSNLLINLVTMMRAHLHLNGTLKMWWNCKKSHNFKSFSRRLKKMLMNSLAIIFLILFHVSVFKKISLRFILNTKYLGQQNSFWNKSKKTKIQELEKSVRQENRTVKADWLKFQTFNK